MSDQKTTRATQQPNERTNDRLIDWPNQKKERKSESAEMNKKNKKCQTESILRMNTQTNSIMQAIRLKPSMENARARNGCRLVRWSFVSFPNLIM